MIPRPPRSTRTDTLFPYTTLFRSQGERRAACRTEAQHLMKRLSAVRSGTDADALAVQDCRYIVGMGAGRGKRQDRTGLFGIAKDGDARNSRESGPRVANKRGLVSSAERSVGKESVSACRYRCSPQH